MTTYRTHSESFHLDNSVQGYIQTVTTAESPSSQIEMSVQVEKWRAPQFLSYILSLSPHLFLPFFHFSLDITMRVSTAAAFILALADTAQSASVPSSYVVHEKRDVTSSTWVKRERIASSNTLPIRIGLKQRNLHRGHEFLMDV